MPQTSSKIIVGWREWVALPTLQLSLIKAKVDTGARTSALHASRIEPFFTRGQKKVRFLLHRVQATGDSEIVCVENIVDERQIMDSGGKQELRYVIRVPIVLGMHTWDIEVSLTDRQTMRFRMLLGRTAMRGRLIVNPALSFLVGRPFLRHSPR